jgi:hypothetical protein
VLRINLKIIIYEFDNNFTVQSRDFPSYLDGKPNLTLLFRKTHYDYVYNDKYFEKYTKELCYFVNVAENLKVVRSTDLEQYKNRGRPVSEHIVDNNIAGNNQTEGQKCLSCGANYLHKPNLFGLCLNCLNGELYNQIMGFYLVFLGESMGLFLEGSDDNVVNLYNECIYNLLIP